MEQSPLIQQIRPDVFQPKVVGLYRHLFMDEDEEDISEETFWRTLFLLKPDSATLRQILDDTDVDLLLHLQHQSHQLILHALASIKAGESPSDENALDTLTVFFAVVFAKKFNSPSSDVIEVLAGLDNIDVVFSDLVATLDRAIRDGHNDDFRRKAVRTAISVVAGGYQTALVSYFIHRDFFPALMKIVHQLDNPQAAAEPLLLTGLLANYNKFESQNQYRSVAWTTTALRERYIAIQDDTPTSWSIGGTLNYLGLGSITGAKPVAPVIAEEQQTVLFSEQPGNEAAVLLTLYDFAIANKLFCHHLVNVPAETTHGPPPFSCFISFASYLYQHAYRTPRASLYAHLTLFILLILVEDKAIAKILSETAAPVRLCRQRPPQLPLVKRDRPYAASVIDLLIDGINHNLRKRLDVKFYSVILTTLSRLLAYLTKSRTRLAYHWSELWRSLLSFVRFLTTYAEELQFQSGVTKLVETLVDVLATALVNGEAYLPDSDAYDDLIYKLVESGEPLVKFRDVFRLGNPTERCPINTLINVSTHYQELIETRKAKSTHLGPREIAKIIKQGYETLSFDVSEGVGVEQSFREAEHRVELKKIARVAVADATQLIA